MPTPREPRLGGGIGFGAPTRPLPGQKPDTGPGSDYYNDQMRKAAENAANASTRAGSKPFENWGPGWQPPPSSAGFGQPEGDFDMRGPGALEKAFEERGQDFFKPTQTQAWWDQNQQRLGGPTATQDYFGRVGQGPAPQGATNVQDYFGQFQNRGRLLPSNLDPYFERARERTANDINSAFAARGMYNSSTATGALGDAMVGLSAEQAQQEANYDLARAAEDRAWTGLGGQLAGGADANALGQAGLNLQHLLGLGGLAQGADRAEIAQFLAGLQASGAIDQNTLNALNSYFGAAAGAQGARRGRVQDFFGNVYAPAAATAGIMGDSFESGFTADQQAFFEELALKLGIPVEALMQDYRNQEKRKADDTWAVGQFGNFMSAYTGMGG